MPASYNGDGEDAVQRQLSFKTNEQENRISKQSESGIATEEEGRARISCRNFEAL